MSIEQWWNYDLEAKLKKSNNTLLQCHFVRFKSHIMSPKIEGVAPRLEVSA
jgi:hypothetical protein